MIIIGITGSIGMGKTTVSSMLRFLGIPVFDSDKEVREILDKNVDVKNEIFKIWPKAMYIEQKVANTRLEEQTKGLNDKATKQVEALEAKFKGAQESLASSQQEVTRLTKSLEEAASIKFAST